MNQCRLCGSRGCEVVNELSSSEIARMYRRVLGIRPDLPANVTLRLHECGVCGLRFFDPVLLGDERLYEKLQSTPGYYMTEKAEFQVALHHLGCEARVLEVGSGPGEFGARINSGNYVGLELNLAAASVARSKGLDVRTDSLRKHLVDLGPASYDAVCAFQVLEHVEDPRAMLRDMVSALKPGGKLIVSVPNEESYVGLDRNGVLNMPPHHQTRWSPRSLRYIPRILPLHLVCIHRENLADYHLNSYLNVVIAEWIDQIFGRQRREIDPLHVSFGMRLFRKVLKILVHPALRDVRLRAVGHTMTAILVKTRDE